MTDRWQFVLNRLRERLWVKPLVVCLVSIGGVFLAHLADGRGLGRLVPEISGPVRHPVAGPVTMMVLASHDRLGDTGQASPARSEPAARALPGLLD